MKKYNFTWVLLVSAGMLQSQVTFAAQWPDVVAPPRSTVAWVADDLNQNGVPMQIQTFTSATSLDELMQFYRQQWTSDEQAAIENQLGEWYVIGQRQGDYYVTVQARQVGKNASEGFIAVNQLKSLLSGRADVDDEFPRLGGTTLVSNTTTRDSSRAAKTLLMENSYTVNANGSFYAGELKSAGWALRKNFERPEAGRNTQVLHFEKDAEACAITLADAGDGRTLIAIHLSSAAK